MNIKGDDSMKLGLKDRFSIVKGLLYLILGMIRGNGKWFLTS